MVISFRQFPLIRRKDHIIQISGMVYQDSNHKINTSIVMSIMRADGNGYIIKHFIDEDQAADYLDSIFTENK